MIAAVLAACTCTLSGCIFVPTRPLATEPFTLTLDGDRIAWFNCYDESVEIEYFSTAVEGGVSGREDSVTLFRGETDVGDSVEMKPNRVLIPQTSFPNMPVLEEIDVRVTDLSGEVTVYLRFYGVEPEQTAEMAFKNVRVSDLAEGRYIYYSGEVSDEPCDF
ncbi:MAG TPA: hypothetical protein VN035_14625 [Microbacterium sp.]|nr:hypothetical protein [Microbacterium sp.]